MFRFFHAPLSPFCRKVRLVLSEKKIEFELIEEKYWEKREDFLTLNPFGQVPVLQNSEITLAESSAICEYLNEKFPDPELLPNNIEDRAEMRRLVSWFDDKFNREVTQKLVYERITKKIIGEGYPEAKNVKLGMHNIAKQTKIFDSELKVFLLFRKFNIDKIIIKSPINCKTDENLKAFKDKPKIISASPEPDN